MRQNNEGSMKYSGSTNNNKDDKHRLLGLLNINYNQQIYWLLLIVKQKLVKL